MMKKALSLLLALAMVMSMFTVGAFADETTPSGDSSSSTETTVTPDGTTKEKAYTWDTGIKTLTAAPTKIVAGGTTELTVTPEDRDDDGTHDDYSGVTYDFTKNDYEYSWSITKKGETAPAANTAIKITSGADTAKPKVKGLIAGEYTVTCTVYFTGDLNTSTSTDGTQTQTENNVPTKLYYKATKTVDIEVIADNYELRVFDKDNTQLTTGIKQSLTILPNGTGTLERSAKLYTKDTPAATEGGSATPSAEVNESGVTVEYKVANTNVATLSGTTVTAVGAGDTYITASVTYMGKEYSVRICDVKVQALGITPTENVINGSYKEYTAASLMTLAQTNLNSVLGNTTDATKLTVSKLELTVHTGSIFSAYEKASSGSYGSTAATAGSKIELTSGDTLKLTAPAGTIKTETWSYTITAALGSATAQTYTGTITLKSDYADTKDVDQTALFAKEEFKLDSVSGISELVKITSSSSAPTSYNSNNTHGASYFELTSSSGTVNFVGYTSSHVAHKVNVTVKPVSYDILAYATDGDTPFKASVFEDFVEDVYDEQVGGSKSVRLDYVKFDTSYSSGKWELKDGSSRVATSGSSSKLSSSELEDITIDVDKSGIYDIQFTAYYETKSSSGSWTDANSGYTGVVRVYATTDTEGDIQYDVSYGQSVTFDASDFEKFYKAEATGSGTKTLSYVVFDMEPDYGTLHTKSGTAYNKSVVDFGDDKFYADPTGSQYDLDKVTYKANSTKTNEYSVYLPFTAYGNKSSVSGIVEVVVNGGLPFTDVKVGDTFYDYIKYCYDNDLMGGKSATKFDVKSSISRIQLVTVLYRMAGSPTTYNSKTLPFTDCKSLSSEFTAALKWAVNKGIVNGVSATKFAPNTAVTRQAMVTILYRYAAKYGYDTGVYGTSINSYTDASKVSSGMKNAMIWAVENGFVSGNNKKLNPTGSTTRGAAAKILGSFHEMYMG